jgi:hypothetical protein
MMGQMMGLITFEAGADKLVVRATPEGHEQASRLCELLRVSEVGIDAALIEMLEDMLANGWETLNDDDKVAIGALTGCDVILTDEAERDDHGKLLKVGRVYWNPNYAVDNEVELLRDRGEITFIEASK